MRKKAKDMIKAEDMMKLIRNDIRSSYNNNPENINYSIERTIYDFEGKLEHAKLELTENIKEAKISIFKTDFKYDENGNPSKVISYRMKPSNKMLSKKEVDNNLEESELKYDDKGRLLKISRNGKITDEFYYAKCGSEEHLSYYTFEGAIDVIDKCKYDKNGYLVYHTIKSVDNPDILLYKYSKTKRRGIYTIFEIENNQSQKSYTASTKEIYKIEDGNKIVISIEKRYKDKDQNNIDKVMYNYDENNNLISIHKISKANDATYERDCNCIYKNGKLVALHDPEFDINTTEYKKVGKYDVEFNYGSFASLLPNNINDLKATRKFNKYLINYEATCNGGTIINIEGDDKHKFKYYDYENKNKLGGVFERQVSFIDAFGEHCIKFDIRKNTTIEYQSVSSSYNIEVSHMYQNKEIEKITVTTTKKELYNLLYFYIMRDFKYQDLIDKINNDIKNTFNL